MMLILRLFSFLLLLRLTNNQSILSYTDILKHHCSPPFHYYKSWCYYIFPNVTLDWSSAYRLCHSIDKYTHLAYISHDDEMLDPLRDILINREKSKDLQSIWTNTTWGQQRRTILSRNARRSCRKIELKSTSKTGQIDLLRMPFSNCREKHVVMCRKELPTNVSCPRPWALIYGICYYLDEQARITKSEEEERNILQCQAWNGQLFSSSTMEKTILLPFLSYSLHSLRSSTILSENFGGISYQFANILQDNCSLISGDVYLSTALDSLKLTNQTKNCSSYNSYTFCRRTQNITCQPPWFYDDGFCLYFSSRLLVDMTGASIECSQNGGYLLYINNEHELFRLTHNLISLAPFFKHRTLAGVWLGLSYRAMSSANEHSTQDFDWRWDLSIESYLDEPWRSTDWKKFFQSRLAPEIVSGGDCASLIVDSKIREPIERTACHHQRTVVCRKPLEYEGKSLHKKRNYDRFVRLQNSIEIVETPRKMANSTNSSSTLTILRSVFEPLNSTTYRVIVYINGSSNLTTNLVLTCKSKGILLEKSIPSHELSSTIKLDLNPHTQKSEYDILFNYLRSSNCTNTSAQQCLYVSCLDYNPWYYTLPEMQIRLERIRHEPSSNLRCLNRYQNSNLPAQICSLLIDQFRISADILSVPFPLSPTNQCQDFGGQCIPDSLVGSSTMPFTAKDLICPKGFICWFEGERCDDNAFCIDRIRFPCPMKSHLSNITCSNTHHDCCTSLSSSTDALLYISTNLISQPWNILLPIYYFSFHGTSKWDQFFFKSWLKFGSDLSHDFINDEFLFSCTAVFIESTLLLTHESCLPTRLTSNDKRSILFSLIPKEETNEYEKVALHVQTYQIYSPFQLVRLAYQHDFLVNKTFYPMNSMKLREDNLREFYCVIVFNEFDREQVRLLNHFERQFLFDDSQPVFAMTNEINDWSFAPILCILQDRSQQWTLIGISGRQLKHQCKTDNHIKYCQMTLILSSL